MRENGSVKKQISPPIDTVYLMDGRHLEFNEQNSVLLGFGCLGYLNDYSAYRLLISANGYFKDVFLRESVIHDDSAALEDIDFSQQYKIRTREAYLWMFKVLGYNVISSTFMQHPDEDDLNPDERFYDLAYFHLQPRIYKSARNSKSPKSPK
jgi:hypothetical protein